MSRICLLRLSALGDATHVAAVARSIRKYQPEAEISWVIGKSEASMLSGLPDVELIQFDKSAGWRGLWELNRALRNRQFDVLLQMQVSLRAGVVSTAIRAQRRVGFSKSRSRELHGLFINERVVEPTQGHVLDGLMAFAHHLGAPTSAPCWDLPITPAARDFARKHLNDTGRTLIISPCSSHALRDWNPSGYAAVADYAAQQHGFLTLLVGGRSQREQVMSERICTLAKSDIKNLTGQDTLPELVAMLAGADLVISPDSGPAHIANAVGTPVIGLYAATDPTRSGPYNSLHHCVDRFEQAAVKYAGKRPEALRWGTKLEYPGVMDLISQGDVCAALDRFMNCAE